MRFGPKLAQLRNTLVSCHLLWIALALLPGCADVKALPANAPAGAASSAPAAAVTSPALELFVPAGYFSKPAAGPVAATAGTAATQAPAKAAAVPFVPAAPMVLKVLLYESTTTRAFLARGGVDAREGIYTWDVFLRKYKIPFELLSSVEQLEKAQPGVLLLPSAVALSEREKQAVMDFRAKGGGVLATWLTGVRAENGEWRGFGFMETALDAKVVGNTEAEKNDTFLMPHADNPVTHALPAGLRVWLEHPKDWYPLRLQGRHPAANIMDWSRTVATGKSSTTLVFDERSQASGKLSRSVVFGYPERLWRSGDPKALEAIAHNALMWLLRQPDAFVANWPHPYGSAFVMAVGATEVLIDVDLLFAKMMEDTGGKASYYVVSELADKSAKILKQIQAGGHEVAYYGDRFEGFKDQPLAAQAKRLDTMRNEMKSAGFDLAADAGFRAPMDSYDGNTEKLLQQRAFGHNLIYMGTAEARLPLMAPLDAAAPKGGKALVILPRTQNAPEDLTDIDPDGGMKTFFAETDLVAQMAGLSVASMGSQSMLTKEQLVEMFQYLKARREGMWLATSGQVADWWRERERVSARLEPGTPAPQLSVTIAGTGPLKQAVTVWVNLPESGTSLRLVARGSYQNTPKIASVDAWRNAVVLEGLAPGEYQWQLYFDRPTGSGAK